MKKLISLLTLIVIILTVSACKTNDENTIKVIATSIPHAEILEFCKPYLKERGFELEIIFTSDYFLLILLLQQVM
jgi:D-methionine transport system substrate-binding protein